MYTGNVSSLRQLACEYAEQSIDRDTYLKNRGRLLDELSGELPSEEEGDNTVRLPIGTSKVSESSDTPQSERVPLQRSTMEPYSNAPVKNLGRHRTLIMAFWVVLGLGGVAIYMIASGRLF